MKRLKSPVVDRRRRACGACLCTGRDIISTTPACAAHLVTQQISQKCHGEDLPSRLSFPSLAALSLPSRRARRAHLSPRGASGALERPAHSGEHVHARRVRLGGASRLARARSPREARFHRRVRERHPSAVAGVRARARRRLRALAPRRGPTRARPGAPRVRARAREDAGGAHRLRGIHAEAQEPAPVGSRRRARRGQIRIPRQCVVARTEPLPTPPDSRRLVLWAKARARGARLAIANRVGTAPNARHAPVDVGPRSRRVLG